MSNWSGINWYKIAKEEKIKGGRADGMPDEKFDAKQLQKGMAVEKEHTGDPEIAKEIAKDHIIEEKKYKGKDNGKHYYDLLKKMEKWMEI